METVRKLKNRITGYWWARIALCLMLVIATGVTVFAWFKKEYKTPGTTVTTGEIDVALQSYKIATDSTTGAQSLVRYLDFDGNPNQESSALYNALQKDVGLGASQGETDDVYFVIRKKDGCIPIDIRLAFNLVGLKNQSRYLVSSSEDGGDVIVTYVGGFYYQLSEVTSSVALLVNSPTTSITSLQAVNAAGTSMTVVNSVTNIEQGLFSYATAQANANNAGVRRNLNSISAMNNENESHTLRDSEYCVYRLTTGINETASQAVAYGGSCFNIELSLVAAQKDGFLSHGTSQTYYAATETQLKNALLSYAPGDSIVLTADVNYTGDLVLTKPVNFYLNHNGGCKLTVNGNFIINYPYNDSFLINTEGNGQIVVLKVNNSEGTFRVDLPLGQLTLKGSGNTAAGMADYYIQSQVFWKASCIPVTSYSSGTTGTGITLDKVLVAQGTGEIDQEQILHPIRIGNNTQLTIMTDTTVGKIYPNHNEEDVERIVIVNYGTIQEQIDLSTMKLVNDSAAYSRYRDDGHCPQIFIDNYGTVSQAIRLPAIASKFYQTTDSTTGDVICHGNTRIIQQRTVHVDMTVVDSESYFKTADIEKIQVNQNVIDVNKDGHTLIVYYADFSEGHTGVSLQSILEEHIHSYTETPGDNFNTRNVNEITSLTVVWQTEKLTLADYQYLRSTVTGGAFAFSGLKELDLSQAISPDDKTVPASAFQNMSNLEKVSIPDDTVIIGNNAFAGTSVKDLYLTKTTTTVGSNALGSIRGVHISCNTVITKSSSIESQDSRRLFFENDSLLAQYEAAGYNRAYLFVEATWLEGTDYYYRFISGTDAELACYVGPKWSQTQTTTLNINDTHTINVGGKDFSVTGIDAYAFYQKIDSSYATEPFTAQFSDKLNTIGAYAFRNCDGLGENIDLGGCKTIGEGAFGFCNGLKVVVGLNVQSLGDSAFYSCKSLLKAKLPSAVTSSTTFYSCSNLVVLEVPASGRNNRASYWYNTKIKLIIAHTEVSTAYAGNDTLAFWQEGTRKVNDYNVILMSEKMTATGGGDPTLVNYATYFGDSKPALTPTQEFTADQYVYVNANANSTTEVRYTYTEVVNNEEVTRYLSDLGYGDYVYGLRDDGHGGKEAVLLACLLQEIKGNYQVPNTVTVNSDIGTNTYPVVEVNKRAYYQVKMQTENADAGTIATTLTFGNNMKVIGDEAFYQKPFTGALDLKNVETLGAKAFYKTGFTSVSLGKVSAMGEYAFAENASLVSIDGADCTEIGSFGFYNCTALLYAKGEKILTVGNNAFKTCTKLIQATFPNAKLKMWVFYGCSSLVVLETAIYNVNDDGNRVIEECTSLKLWIVHPESTNSETPSANSYLNGLWTYYTGAEKTAKYVILFSQATDTARAYYTAAANSTTLPSAERHIYTTGNFLPEDYAFTNGGTNTNYYTFADGSNMKRLSDLTDCDGRAYGDYVWGLDKANHTATLLYSLVTAVGNSTNQTTYADLPEYVYRMEDDGSGNLTQVAYAVTTLQQNCFANTSFTKCDLLIPDNLRTIEDRVFLNKGINGELHLKNVTSVGLNSIASTKLEKLYLGKISTMGAFAFNSTSTLTYVDCEQATVIGNGAFASDSNLTTVEFHGDNSLVASIGSTAFENCTSLQSIDARAVKSVGHKGLMGCTSLTYVNMPELTTFDANGEQFSGCKKLVTVNIPKVTKIEKETFLNCSSLPSIDIPLVTTIGTSAFSGCSKLGEIEGPNVLIVDSQAFNNCLELRRAIFPNGQLNRQAMAGCSKLVVLESVPTASYVGAGNAVITGCSSLKYWYLNTESSNKKMSSYLQYTYSYKSNGNLYLYNTTPANDSFVLLISEKAYNGNSVYNYIMNYSNVPVEDETIFTHVLSSQTFVPTEYVYVNASDTDTTVTRYSVTDAGGTKYYLSDLGAGDYVFGIKSNNQAVLLACLLKEIKAGYQVPDTVTVGGVTYPVTEINKRAFTRVNFLSGASVAFGDNLTTIGARAFKGAAIEGTLNLNNVTTVGEYAFYKNKLTTLNLDAVTTAGDYAFADSPITTLGLGHLTTMGEHTLQNLSSLQTLNCDYAGIAEDNTTSFAWLTCSTVNCGHISRIGKNKFYRSGHAMGNPNLVTINMDYCPVVGEGAFYQCANVTAITATNVTEIETSGFAECTGVTSIALPNVTDIGKYAFKKCTKLANVTFGSLETLDTGSFEDCTALTAIDLGDHIISIGDVLTFSGCTKLVSIDFGSLTQTYGYTCSGCTSLTTVIMPNVTKVGQCAFDGCTSLASIDLANVTSVGLEAFENCPLTNLHLGKVSYIGTDAFKGTTIVNLYCDQCTLIEVDNFAEFTGKTSLETVDLGSVTRVGKEVFKGCSGITSLTIGTACTEIGESAFENCYRIASLDLKNVTTIGTKAFKSCPSITTIDFGQVTEIGGLAFQFCTGLTEVDLDNVTTLGNSVFSSCSHLATVHLGKLTTVGSNPFNATILSSVYCDEATILEQDTGFNFCWQSNITFVDLGSLTRVGSEKFRGTGITSLDSKNVTVIADGAFENCVSLVTADLSSVVTIGSSGFTSCTKLETVTFRDIESIGQSGFQCCKILTLDFTGLALNSLGTSAFLGNASLTTVTFGDDLEGIPAWCFQDCTSLTTVNFGGITNINSYAFKNDKALGDIDLAGITDVGGFVFQNGKIQTLHLGTLPGTAINGLAFKGPSGTEITEITNIYCDSCSAITTGPLYFTDNTSIKYVNLGNLTGVGANVFKGCTGITTLVWTGSTLTSIGANAFDGDLNMSGSYDFSHVTSIGASAFNACALLTGTVDLSACTTLGAGAFTGTAISSVDMGSLLTTVGSSAFMNCVELETLNLGHVTELGSSAFKSCLKLSSAQSNYVTKVGTSCFYGCNNLISVLMPNLCDFSNGTTRDANGLDTFASCSNLAVIETAFPAFTGTETTFRLGGIFDGSTKLRVWIMHPENNTVSGNKTLKLCYASGTSAHAFSLFGSSWNNTVNSNFRIVIPQNGVATSSLFDNVNDVEILNTGTFMTFNWGNVTDHTGEGRLSYGLSNNKHLSDYGCGDYLYYVDTTTGKAVIVTALLDSLTGSAYTVPQTLYADESDPTTALTVSGIGAMAYYHVDCASSLSVALTLGGSIASVGDSAFKGLAGIKGLTLGDSVLAIGNDAFNGTKITGALDLNKVTTLGTGNFKGSAITSLDCGDNLTAIAADTFSGCNQLLSLNFGNVVTLGDRAFKGCTKLTSLNLGNITTLGSDTFSGCTGVTVLHLGHVATVGTTPFQSCPIETLYCDSASIIEDNDAKLFYSTGIKNLYCCNITRIGNNAFQDCSQLKTVDFASVQTIGNTAFRSSGLITLPSSVWGSVTTLGNDAFYSCPNLTTVDLRGANVTTAGEGCFMGCNALTDIYLGSLTAVSQNMFRQSPNIVNVDFGNVTSIGTTAFLMCTKLSDLDLKNVTSFGVLPFSGAVANSIHIRGLQSGGLGGLTVTTLYCDNAPILSTDGAFSGASIKYIDCCQVTTIAKNMFNSCTKLEAINFRNVTTINEQAFQSCTKLTSTLNDDGTITAGLNLKNVQTVGIRAFSGCTALATLNLNNATSVLQSGFSSCTGLVTVDMGSVATLEQTAFIGCTKLEAVNFRNVTSIGQSAFNGCTSLANTLNDDGTISAGLDFKNVTSLGWESFTGCTKLYYVVGNNVTACSRYVFSGCTKLVKAVLPKTKLGVQMFGGCTSLLVLECALASDQYPLSACTGLKLIVLHPESANSTSLSLFNNSPLNNYWGGDPFSTNYYVLCTNDVANNDVNYYDITTLSAGNFHIVPTGTYFPNQYVYGNASNSENVVRVTYTDENGATKYLSDLGYGDYVYGVDSMGNATMFACLLDEVTDSYTTPESVTVGSSTYYVKEIGERAYSQVDFTDGTLSVANGVTTLGRYAFGNPYNTARAADSYSITIPYSVTSIGTNAFDGFGSCVNLRLMGDSVSALDAPNVFGASPTLPDGFKIKVRKTMLPKYQNYTGDAWGGIATSHVYFEAMDIVYVDTTTNVTYYLANNGDNTYTLSDVELPSTFSATTLTLLSVYPGDGTLDGDLAGNVIAIGYNALAGIKTIAITSIILPDSLASLDNQNFIYPTALQSFTISASNPNYDTLDGVLYTEGKTVLLIYPMAKTDTTFALPAEVIAIAPAAFKNVAALQTVTATAEGTFSGYLFVSEESFVNCEALTEVSFGRTAIMSNNVFTGCYALAQVHYLGAGTNLFLGSEPYGDRTVTETYGA